jgi:hypothetical protein
MQRKDRKELLCLWGFFSVRCDTFSIVKIESKAEYSNAKNAMQRKDRNEHLCLWEYFLYVTAFKASFLTLPILPSTPLPEYPD